MTPPGNWPAVAGRPRLAWGSSPVRPLGLIGSAECSDTHGMLVLSWGRCTMQAGPGLLTLHAEAPNPGSLARIQDLVAGRLEKFGRREQLTVAWQPVQAPGPVSS